MASVRSVSTMAPSWAMLWNFTAKPNLPSPLRKIFMIRARPRMAGMPTLCHINSGAASDSKVSKSSSARANRKFWTVRALAAAVVNGVVSTSSVMGPSLTGDAVAG